MVDQGLQARPRARGARPGRAGLGGLAVLAVLAGLTLAGCSDEPLVDPNAVSSSSAAVPTAPATAAVAQQRVEERVGDLLVQQGLARPDSVSCPGGLDAAVGATLSCTATTAGVSAPVTVTVTAVDGDQVTFGATVGSAGAAPSASGQSGPAPTVRQSEVEAKIASSLAGQLGQTTVSCPGDLPGVVGQSISCTLTGSDGNARGVSATVRSVQGSDVQLDIRLDQG